MHLQGNVTTYMEINASFLSYRVRALKIIQFKSKRQYFQYFTFIPQIFVITQKERRKPQNISLYNQMNSA